MSRYSTIYVVCRQYMPHGTFVLIGAYNDKDEAQEAADRDLSEISVLFSEPDISKIIKDYHHTIRSVTHWW